MMVVILFRNRIDYGRLHVYSEWQLPIVSKNTHKFNLSKSLAKFNMRTEWLSDWQGMAMIRLEVYSIFSGFFGMSKLTIVDFLLTYVQDVFSKIIVVWIWNWLTYIIQSLSILFIYNRSILLKTIFHSFKKYAQALSYLERLLM